MKLGLPLGGRHRAGGQETLRSWAMVSFVGLEMLSTTPPLRFCFGSVGGTVTVWGCPLSRGGGEDRPSLPSVCTGRGGGGFWSPGLGWVSETGVR